MLFSSCCSEIPDVTFLFFFLPPNLGKCARLPATQLNKLVWPNDV
jgi:hypothetical protein